MTTPHYGPTNPFSERLHAEKYRLEGETFRDCMNRGAAALKDDDEHFQAYRDITLNMRFMPAGRIQAAMGSPKAVTPYNCFVSGTIHDSFTHGDGSIMQRASEAASTMRMGGGIGYDFSTLRPSGDLIRGVQALTDGPLAFMPINDAVCKATSSAGNRRGAQMGVMRIDHPDIIKFIHAKHPPASVKPLWDHVEAMENGPEKKAMAMALQSTLPLSGFNLSVAVTDRFMECLKTGKGFELKWDDKVYDTVDAEALWEMLMRSTWDYAEPGVLFVDAINRLNNLWYCETIAATNPCGEQPLPPFGACLLGSFNLAKYMVQRQYRSGYSQTDFDIEWDFDWDRFKRDIPIVVRAMDNVVDRASYPLREQEIEAKNKRRMGLGITALANAAEALGVEYGSFGFIEFERQVLTVLRDEAYLASANLAAEKGSFPLYDEELYLQGNFVKQLPDHVRDAIKRNGIRNSHLTSIAPTGTISFCADYVSSGIEPVFEHEGERLVIMPGGTETVKVADYAAENFGVQGKLAERVTAKEHVDVLVTAARLVDSAVSKTCNVDGSMPWEDFKGIYERVWEAGGKGCTTFNKDGKRLGILLSSDEDDEAEQASEGSSCEIDPATGRRSCE
jgi:ribonucleoside-diphosphate reductase alpha chain